MEGGRCRDENRKLLLLWEQIRLSTMKHACDVLDELGIPYEKKVVSAHRTPDYMFEYAEKQEKGI